MSGGPSVPLHCYGSTSRDRGGCFCVCCGFVADNISPCIVGGWDKAEVGLRFGPADWIWRITLVWILCNKISGEAASIRHCAWRICPVYLRSTVNDNVLDETMSRDLDGRNKQPQECSGLHHGRHFDDRMVIGRLECKERDVCCGESQTSYESGICLASSRREMRVWTWNEGITVKCSEVVWEDMGDLKIYRVVEGRLLPLGAGRPTHQMKSKFSLGCFKNCAQSHLQCLALEWEDHIKWLRRLSPWCVDFGDEEGMIGGEQDVSKQPHFSGVFSTTQSRKQLSGFSMRIVWLWQIWRISQSKLCFEYTFYAVMKQELGRGRNRRQYWSYRMRTRFNDATRQMKWIGISLLWTTVRNKEIGLALVQNYLDKDLPRPSRGPTKSRVECTFTWPLITWYF